MNTSNSIYSISQELEMDEEIFEIKSYNSNKEYPFQKKIPMKISNSFSSISIVPDLDKDEVSELKSYNYNFKYTNKSLPIFFDKDIDKFDNNLSNNIIFNETNGVSQDIKEENQIEIRNKNNKEKIYVEIDNKAASSFGNLQKIKKNQNTCNIIFNKNNSKINEEKIKNQKIFKVIYSNILNNSDNFIIFTDGYNNDFWRQIINEALNDVNKNSKKVKTKKIFLQIPPKPKKKKKNIQKRKENSDNIRKKIKARFLKALRNAINQKLKKAGSKYIFQLLPQSFITNLSKDKNRKILNLTLKEIFLKNFNDKEKGKKTDYNKYKHNSLVLDYLEKNNDISEKANFNKIKNMKYSEVFNEYLLSKEFESEISTLKQQKENDKYIKDYIIKARNFINFFNQ